MAAPLLPHDYQRRILLLVSGMSPQIVTETLYALLCRQSPPFVPTEVHLISTTTGAEQARLNLLAGLEHFYQFCKDYGLDKNVFTAERISIIKDSQGRELADIHTPEENEATADFIAAKIRELTADTKAALHVSMAGGRKTMGYYAGYALSLFGRPQDRLSHVLVEEGYEGLREFYYPTRATRTIQGRDGKALDAAKATISLAEIPLVRLREGLSSSLLNGTHSFSKTVELASKAREKPQLELTPATGEYRMNGESGRLSSVPMALLLWAATRKTPIEPLVDGEKSPEYAQEISRLRNKYGLSLHGKTQTILDQGDITKGWLESNISKLNSTLSKQLGPELAALCKLAITTCQEKSGYALPENLEITLQQGQR